MDKLIMHFLYHLIINVVLYTKQDDRKPSHYWSVGDFFLSFECIEQFPNYFFFPLSESVQFGIFQNRLNLEIFLNFIPCTRLT